MKIPFHPTKTKRASFFAHREYLFLHFSTNQITVTHRKRSLLLLLLLLLYHHYHSHSLSLPRVYRHSILSSLPPKCCCCLRNFHNRSSGAHTFTDVQCRASHCSPRDVMSKRELSRMKSPPVPLATLIGRELRNDKVEKPFVKYGQAGLAKKGEDYFLIKTDCHRVPGDPSTVFSVFAIFDGHNGISAAIFAKENLLTNVLSAIPQGISRDAWLQALPRALVVGFVKTDTELQQKGETSGTTATFVVVDGWTVTVASVGDSRCILDTQGGVVSLLTVDHRLEENAEERERVTASGGEVGRLNIFGGNEVGPLRCWPGGLCLSRSIGDTDVGEFIVPIPHVKQVKLSNAGGRLIIASDGIWDALSSDTAAKSCRGLPAELAAKLVVKEALRSRGLKDDTTCLVVDIIPSDLPVLPPTPRKKHNMLTAFLFGKKSENSANKATSKLSSVGVVEELFEEGSAMLSERLGKDFPFSKNSGIFRCAVCQVDQPPAMVYQ